MSTKTLITVEEFGNMHFPDTEDYELVDGELIPLSSGTYRHSKIRSRLERPNRSLFRTASDRRSVR
jgi:hypothetical protein